MSKKAISIFLIWCLLLQLSTRIGIYAYYHLNKDYISEVLCINKDKPKLHCNGKCFLAKKLKAQEEKENKIPFQLKSLQEITLFFNPPGIIFKRKAIVENIKANSHYILGNYSASLNSPFHPPQS